MSSERSWKGTQIYVKMDEVEEKISGLEKKVEKFECLVRENVKFRKTPKRNTLEL